MKKIEFQIPFYKVDVTLLQVEGKEDEKDVAELLKSMDVEDSEYTLEVKEVDLEKEIQAFAKLYLYPIKVYDANVGISITMHQLYLCAKHFFELGLKTQKGE